jgi:hypothetical protein
MPPASRTMTADPIRNSDSTRTKQRELAYNEMTMGQSGSVMKREQKEALREKHGFCTECVGLPVQLYEIKKNKLNPLWQSKISLDVKGQCMSGKCYVCHPDLDPDRTAARRRRGGDNRRPFTADTKAPSSNRIDNNNNRGRSSGDQNHATSARGISGELPMRSPVMNAAVAAVRQPSAPPMRMEEARVAIRSASPKSRDPLPASAPAPAMRASMPSSTPAQLGSVDLRGGDPRSLRTLPNSSPSASPLASPTPPVSQPHPASSARRKPAFEGVFVPDAVREASVREIPSSEINSGHFSSGDSLNDIPPVQENNNESVGDDLELIYNRVRQQAAPPTMNDLPEEPPLTRKNNPSADESDSLPATQPSPASTLRKPSVQEDDMMPPPVPSVSAHAQAHAEDSAPLRDAERHGQTSVESLSSDHSVGNDSSTTFGSHPLPPQESPSSPPPPPPTAAPLAPPTAAPIPSVASEQVETIIDGLAFLVKDMVAAEGGSEFVADVILGTMREYTSQEQIQTYCLRAIWDLCKDDQKQKQYVMQAGATESIMRALRNFSDSLLVQEKGCGAIWSLGVNSHNRVVLVRAGACERVVTAMKKFMMTETLVRTAIGALRTLSPELEARDAFKPLKASEITAKAMMHHRSSVSIQRDGCAFLSNCAVNIEKQFVAVVPLEELDAVVQAMANHREEVSVMQGACFALKNYTFEEKNCRSLRLCEGLDELVAHASMFVASPSCPEDANDILERMQLSRAADESIEDQAQISLFTLIESQGNSPQAQPVLEFIRSYDWSPRLISTGLQCFRRMCSEDDTQLTRIIEILADIIRLVNQNERAADAVEEACQLVATLSELHDNHNAIIEAGACNVVFNALTRHVDNERVVKAALDALKPLSCNFECWCDTEGGGRVQLVTDAIAAHATCEMVQVNGVAVMSNLDFFRR